MKIINKPNFTDDDQEDAFMNEPSVGFHSYKDRTEEVLGVVDRVLQQHGLQIGRYDDSDYIIWKLIKADE